MTLSSLFEASCLRFSNRTACRSVNGDALTYKDMRYKVNHFASEMRRHGLMPGHHVGLFMENGIDFVIAYWALQKISAITVLLAPFLKPWDLSQAHRTFDIDFWLTDSSRSSLIKRLAHGPTWSCLDDHLELTASRSRRKKGQSQGFAVILPTSGTTGLPKGVMLTAKALSWNARAIINNLKLTKEEKTLVVMPLTSAQAQTFQLLAHWMVGGELIFSLSTIFPQEILRALKTSRATNTSMVPSLFGRLLSVVEDPQHGSLRRVLLSGEIIDPVMLKRSRYAFPLAKIIKAYGLSEAGPRVAQSGSRRQGHSRYSVGKPLTGVTVKIVDGWGKTLNTRHVGQILVKSPSLMKGYYGVSDQTADVLQDGWLRTGDVGKLSTRGFLHVLGRTKNIIIKNGFKISPEELEFFLGRFEGVQSAAVFHRVDSRYGERIVALIVAKTGVVILESELLRYCRENLAAVKVPDEIHCICSLPYLGNGKLDRGALSSIALRSPRENVILKSVDGDRS